MRSWWESLVIYSPSRKQFCFLLRSSTSPLRTKSVLRIAFINSKQLPVSPNKLFKMGPCGCKTCSCSSWYVSQIVPSVIRVLSLTCWSWNSSDCSCCVSISILTLNHLRATRTRIPLLAQTILVCWWHFSRNSEGRLGIVLINSVDCVSQKNAIWEWCDWMEKGFMFFSQWKCLTTVKPETCLHT